MKKPFSKLKATNPNHISKVKKPAEKCNLPIKCWELFFDKQMIKDIVNFTNIKLLSQQPKFQRARDCATTDVTEIRALFGLLYLAGALKMSRVNLKDIWATDGTSPDYFRCTMSFNRFNLLLRALRFDDVNTRKQRASLDKFAPIREVWKKFNTSCQDNYTPGQVLTVNDMMSAFRSRCSFKQYMPKKPDKYGLKTWALVDSESFYVTKMEMYLEKQQNKTNNKPANVIKRIADSVLNTGRTLVMNNWFTSVPLIQELKNHYNTIVVGTVRKNKTELPPDLVVTKKKEQFTVVCLDFKKMLCLCPLYPGIIKMFLLHRYIL
ncbi:uncharacterized protein LOC103575593 [Microplitis demolitor]|uniref:uncharacterized protein LOC103575593 n=1 Tax=Microplitis demolitor TaxID=69319 RepID=UPI0004CD2F6C|nr:uncharacterized protein LOC103575593 [Microplitis demolitor]